MDAGCVISSNKHSNPAVKRTATFEGLLNGENSMYVDLNKLKTQDLSKITKEKILKKIKRLKEEEMKELDRQDNLTVQYLFNLEPDEIDDIEERMNEKWLTHAMIKKVLPYRECDWSMRSNGKIEIDTVYKV